MLSCILFDLDGTLIDSAPDLCASANFMRERAGLLPLPYEAMREDAGKGARGMLWASLRLPKTADNFEELKSIFLAHYEAHISEHSTLFDGVAQMIADIEAAGLKWGIVTNKAEHLARKLCAAKGISPNTDCIVSGSDLGAMKPRPDPVLEGMRRAMSRPEETIYVGDDARDAASAKAAGVRFIAASWGYVNGGIDIRRWGADILAKHPTDVIGAARSLCR